MVDLQESRSLVYNRFRGLNLRDDENQLEIGQTPNAKNNEIVSTFGTKKRKGTQVKLIAPEGVAWDIGVNYSDNLNYGYYLTVNYPHISLTSKATGLSQIIYSGFKGVGDPFVIKGLVGDAMIVDGQNNPVYVSNGTATELSWPPNYIADNAALLNESPNANGANPTALKVDIDYPSFGVLYEGRYYLSGDQLQPKRLYASKLFSGTEFGRNDTLNRDIPFWLDVVTNSKITGLANLNDKFMIIFCENELHYLSGAFPPASFVTAPKISLKALNRSIGGIGLRTFAQKGNTDLFFISDRKTLYSINTTENFQDARPLGISEIVYPAFEALTENQLKRSILVNDEIKGELQIYYPKDEDYYYANERLVYNYSETNQNPEWSQDIGFKTPIINAFIDKESKKVILITRDKILENDTGLNYDGEIIDMFYQLSTLDFEDKDRKKKILEVEIGYQLLEPSTTQITFSHLWEDGSEDTKTLDLTRDVKSKYGSAVFGESKYSSNAGEPLSIAKFPLLNPEGRILKCAIRSQGECDLTIAYVKFRYLMMGT